MKPRSGWRRSACVCVLQSFGSTHTAAFNHASAMLARAPDDASAGIGLTRAAAATFQPELAWRTLVSIPRKSPDGGAPRRGAGALRSLVGQIVNDLRLRSHESAELAAATKLGEDKLVERAAAQMRADSGNFAAALGLLIGLARADGFGTASSFPVARANFQVPGILHQYWDKDPPPQDVQSLMARAKKMNPYFSTDAGRRGGAPISLDNQSAGRASGL